MKVSDLVSIGDGDVVTLSPEATLLEAAQLMAAHNFGVIIVADGDLVAGILSERDVVRAIGLRGASELDETVASVMIRDVEACTPDDHLQDVMAAMARGRFRHMPVLARGQLRGIISARDILRYLERTATDQQRAFFFSKIAWT